MRYAIFLFTLLIGAVAMADDSDQVAPVKANDPAMLAAFAKAREGTDEFITLLLAKSEDSYSVKVKVSDGAKVEYFRISDLTYRDGVFHGTVDDAPEYVHTVKLGQQYDVKKADIFDWLYTKEGKIYGNYTQRALRPKLPKEEADKMRAMFAV